MKTLKVVWGWLTGFVATLSLFSVVAHVGDINDFSDSIDLIVRWWRAFTAILLIWLPFHIGPVARDLLVLTLWALGVTDRTLRDGRGWGLGTQILNEVLPETPYDPIPRDRFTPVSNIVGGLLLIGAFAIMISQMQLSHILRLFGYISIAIFSLFAWSRLNRWLFENGQNVVVGAAYWFFTFVGLPLGLVGVIFVAYRAVWVHRSRALNGIVAVIVLLIANAVMLRFGDPFAPLVQVLLNPPNFDGAFG